MSEEVIKKPKKQSKKKTNQAQQQINELTEALKRSKADYVNQLRRTQENEGLLRGKITQSITKEMIPVLDNIQRGLSAVPEDQYDSELYKGFQKVSEQFQKALDSVGVEEIEADGQAFDPETMEAVAVEGEGSHEIVSEVLQAGYRLGSYVIRPAVVKVARHND